MADQRNATGGVSRTFVQRTLVVLLLVGLALLAVHLSNVLLLVFGAVLIAVILRAVADPLSDRLKLPQWLSLILAVLLLAGLIGLTFFLFGAQIVGQVQQLADSLPGAVDSLKQRIASLPYGQQLMTSLQGSAPGGGNVLGRLGGWAMTLSDILSNIVVVVVSGIFLATEPRLYERGLVKLFPKHRTDAMQSALHNTGRALRKWLLGQLVSMTLVGVLTGIGLWLIGVPSPLALALIAGLSEFIPLVGPTIGAVPGLLIALSAGPETALWAALVYLGVQQVESNLITPLVEKHVVSLPPSVTLIAVLAIGTLFGPLGVLLSAPLAVVLYALVNQLYVRDLLGRNTKIPGAQNG